MNNPLEEKVKIYTLGGSIDKIYSMKESDFIVGTPTADSMLKQANVSTPFEIEEFLRKDSLEITDEDRKLLRSRIEAEQANRIIITHGTDTMHLTGQALSPIKNKIVVITGAMQPAAFKDSDAEFNLGSALIAVQTLPYGIYIVMNGQIFKPDKVKKNMEAKSFEVIH